MADDKKQSPKRNPEAKRAAADQKARDRAAQEAEKEKGRKKKPVADADPLHPKTRKGKKELLKRQKEKERELVEQGVIPPRNKYKPRGFFWRVLGICLAFFMGIFATVGGAVGAGVILLNRPAKDLLSTLRIPLDDVDKILSEDYLNKSVFAIYDDLMGEVIPNLSDPSALTLGVISKYTPLVDNYITETLMPNLESLGIHLELNGENGLKTVPLNGIADYAMGTLLPQVKLGPVLGLDKDVTLEKIDKNAPMYALCYGKLGVDYTIGTKTDESGTTTTVTMLDGHAEKGITDLIPTLKKDSATAPTAAESGGEDEGGSNSGGIMDVLGGLELGSFLGLDIRLSGEEGQNNAMLYAMCYGSEGADYTFVPLMDSSDQPIEGGQVLKRTEDGKAATTVDKLISDSNSFINDLSLGSLLGLESAESLENRANNAMMYTLCYGTENVDWEVKDGKLVMFEGHDPVTIGKLTTNSNDVLNDLPLGEMLGLNTAEKVADRSKNALMYSLCYGVEGVDFTVDPDTGLIEMMEGVDAVTLGDLTSNSSEYINKMEVDTVLGITAESDSILRTVAFGNEAAKDENGAYIMDGDDPSKFATEKVKDPETGEPKEELQYLNGGKYYIEEGEGGKKTVVMLPDPNDPDGKTYYSKKTIGDLTAADANLLDGVTLGSLLNYQEGQSGIMDAMQSWTIDDLKDQSKIESLELGQVLQIEPDENGAKPSDVSNIMWALRETTIGELKDQNTINNLKLQDVLKIEKKEESSGILWAMKEWTLADLNQQEKIESLTIGQVLNGKATSGIMKAMESWTIADLNNQNRIERLKIGQIIETKDSTSTIIKAIENWSVSDLTDSKKIDSLALGDVIKIDDTSPQMLLSLQNMTLGEVATGIDTLTLEDVLGEQAFGDNKILNALKDTQVNGLGAAIKALTIEDIFGDDIWSYAKNYVKDTRPLQENVLTKENIEVFHYHGDEKTKVVTGGWYTGSEGNFKKVPDGAKIIKSADTTYVEQEIALEQKIKYYIFDYSDPSNKVPYSGENIEHDTFTAYYVDEDGKRIDLGEEFSYTLKSGAPAPEGIHVRKKVIEGVTSYYYIEKTEITYRYADDTTTYPDDNSIHKAYKEKGTGAEVGAYHAGVWYLLLGEGETIKITDMGSKITGIANTINTMKLGDMYNHELIEKDPSFDLSKLKEKNLTTHENLNELTISEVIDLVQKLAGTVSGFSS